ncbi:MAG: DUF7935 family protein [Luteibaculaceae bacterium]
MEFWQVLLMTLLPSGTVILVTYMLVKSFLGREEFQRKADLLLMDRKNSAALKLQAAERLMLFLERLHPSSLMLRLNVPTASARALQISILKTVREEFEHNFAQQIYVSENTWKSIRNAKEEVLGLLNSSANKLNEKASANDLVREMFNADPAKNYPSLELAKKQIRAELKGVI